MCGGIGQPSGLAGDRSTNLAGKLRLAARTVPICVHTACQARARHLPRTSSTRSTTCGRSNNYFFTSRLKSGQARRRLSAVAVREGF